MLLLIRPDNPAQVARRGLRIMLLVTFDDIEVLQPRPGVKQHDPILFTEVSALAQLAISRQRSSAFGCGEHAFCPRPLPQSIHDLVIAHRERNAVAFLQNIQYEVVTVRLGYAQARSQGRRIRPWVGDLLALVECFRYGRATACLDDYHPRAL